MPEWKVYISTKITRACPATWHEFLVSKGAIIDPAKDADLPGYLVQYRDGYISWCPKEEFELANRELTELEINLIH
jgi:hypothetical protein